MQNIYDTIAKLNKVANAPEIVKEDSNALMKKGLEDLMRKTKFNKDADYKPFGKDDKDYETGLPKDAKKDKMFDDMAAADASKMNKASTYTPFSDKQSPDGLPEKKKDNKMFEKESDVERDDRAEKAGREVKRDAKYDDRRHAGKDGKSVTKDIEYDEKHDKDGMHEAQGYDDKEDESLGMRTGKESGKKQSMKDRRDDSYGKFGKRDKEHADGKMHVGEDQGYDDKEDESLGMRTGKEADKKQSMKDRRDDSYGKFGKRDKEHADGKMHEASKTMVKGPDGKMVPDYAVDGKGKDDMKETNSGTLKDAARQGVMARLAELAGIPAQEIEEALGTPQDIADKIMHENPMSDMEDKHYPITYTADISYDDRDRIEVDNIVIHDTNGEMLAPDHPVYKAEVGFIEDEVRRTGEEEGEVVGESITNEAEVEEGNEFSGERDKAIKAGKNDFTVDGKTYPVKGDKNESLEEDEELDEGAVKDMMQDVEEGMDKKEFEKKYPGNDYDGIKKDIKDKMDEGDEKVEETTSSGSVATGDGAGKPLYKNASIYENNEIVKRARQLNEDMSFTVSGGPDQEPTLNINASGAEAQQLGQLLKLSGLGMQPAAPQYGEVEIQVAEDQEFANGADDQNTMDTQYMTQDIAGGLNGPKKMAYPKVAGADNPMSVLGESELNEVGEERLMKLYQEYKAK